MTCLWFSSWRMHLSSWQNEGLCLMQSTKEEQGDNLIKYLLGTDCPQLLLWKQQVAVTGRKKPLAMSGKGAEPWLLTKCLQHLWPHKILVVSYCQGCWLLSLTSSGIECAAQWKTKPFTSLKWSFGFHIYLQTRVTQPAKPFCSLPGVWGRRAEETHVPPAQWQLMNKIILVFALTRLASPTSFT